jgi:hypothetical protein
MSKKRYLMRAVSAHDYRWTVDDDDKIEIIEGPVPANPKKPKVKKKEPYTFLLSPS